MKFAFYVKWGMLGTACLLASTVLAAPSTQVQTFRPSTQMGVARPATSVAVQQLHTGVAVDKPATSLAVAQQGTSVSVRRNVTSVKGEKPETTVAVLQSTTTVGVDKPATSARMVRPGEPDWRAETEGYYTRTFPSRDTVKESSAENKPSMMSSYQAPQAKELKAAPLGKGEEGLGNKVNEAEKDAAAAALNLPKAEEASFENVKESIGKSKNIQKAVEKEIK